MLSEFAETKQQVKLHVEKNSKLSFELQRSGVPCAHPHKVWLLHSKHQSVPNTDSSVCLFIYVCIYLFMYLFIHYKANLGMRELNKLNEWILLLLSQYHSGGKQHILHSAVFI